MFVTCTVLRSTPLPFPPPLSSPPPQTPPPPHTHTHTHTPPTRTPSPFPPPSPHLLLLHPPSLHSPTSPPHYPPHQVFWLSSVRFLTFLLRPQRATSKADVARDAHVVGCSAWRRRNRRLRSSWRHEQQAVRMAVAAATHHSYDRSSAHACTQTDLVYVTPAPVVECVAPAPAVTYVVPSQQLPLSTPRQQSLLTTTSV